MEEHKSKYHFEKLVEECKYLKCKDHTVILYKGLSNKRTTWSSGWRSIEWRNCVDDLEGLPRSWDSFIQGIRAKIKLITFNRLWEEFSQEEARIVAWEGKMGNEYQALTARTKKIRRDYHQSKGKHSHSIKTQLRCFTCDEIGHYARNCPRNKRNSHKKNDKRKYHAHTT